MLRSLPHWWIGIKCYETFESSALKMTRKLVMKSESYSVSSLISSSDQEPVLDKINQDVNTLLNQIKALQDEVRRKSTELTNANQRIVALVEINKRISRRNTSTDESSSGSETFSSRLRTLGRKSRLNNLQYQTPKSDQRDNQGSEIRVCEKSTNKNLFIKFIKVKNLFRKASVVAI